MSSNTGWDINSYREEHESDEHWELRRKFMVRWKDDFPEERLVCLARVFANVELLGCRYPAEVMQEIAKLSHDVAKTYRNSRKDKLKRTFVSASDAAEDRAKGVKREGGVIVGGPAPKSAKIQFVKSGESNTKDSDSDNEDSNKNYTDQQDLKKSCYENVAEDKIANSLCTVVKEHINYAEELERIKCVDVRYFNERMFNNSFGRMVLFIRPWTSKLGNIQSSCQACNMALSNTYTEGVYSLTLNNQLLAQSTGPNKPEAKNIVETLAWNRLCQETVSLLVKEQWIAQNDSRITMSDVTGRGEQFGKPVDLSVAAKMMKLMGWQGGGLGAGAQGIAEPIKPQLQMVNRAGLGSLTSDIKQLRRSALDLMQRYIASDTLDVDLVFTNEFTKEERAALHMVAKRAGLASKSYGADNDRFLVVKKKLDPFSLVRAVIEKGGNTPKYQVYIPAAKLR